jgi:hypothetical protein
MINKAITIIIILLFISTIVYFKLNKEKCECFYQKNSGIEYRVAGKCPKIKGGFIILNGEKVKIKKVKTICK